MKKRKIRKAIVRRTKAVEKYSCESWNNKITVLEG
ncbi:DUF3983 domain-containing protein [Bacillus toyonensis]|nr:DUF3983 domain-containing protein [Bacillus toyonensis]PEP79487.1 DUF3983 domain-containing protein [Bacillus toyonensis]